MTDTLFDQKYIPDGAQPVKILQNNTYWPTRF